MSFTHRGGYRTFAGTITAFSMQQDKISIDLKLPTKWEDLSDKQLRYVFALLVERREGACSHLCRSAAGVALATPSW